MRFSTSGLFFDSVSPKPLSIPLGPFLNFFENSEIFAAQGPPPVSLTPVSNFKFTLWSEHRDIITSGKFAAGALTLVVNLDLRISTRIFKNI
jgi:hypothetical protein